ncbi:MAG TPA: O-antigen ligase family protein [Gaiellaceae bacterium]|nr:O-antigen ligase family protein [Gaiellaceae bacterium]
MPSVRAAVAPVLIAAVVAALAFDQAGFFPHAWVWAAVLFFWGSILALLLPGDVRVGRPYAAFLAAIALLAGWTLLSHVWSAVPGQALLEARRDLVYLGAAAVVVAGCSRMGARRLVGALLVSVEVVVAVALARYLTVSPSHRTSGNQGALLSWPAGYANALAALAALAVPLGLSVAAHARGVAARRAAAAGVPPLVAALVLSGSRGGSIAAATAALALLLLDPRRIPVGRATVRLAGPVAIVVGACVWSRLTDPMLAADDVRRGRIVVAAALALGIGAAAFTTAARQRAHRGNVPSRRALAAVALVAVLLAAFVSALPKAGGDRALRSLVGGQRAAYWTTAWTQIDAHPVAGDGAGTFGLAWLEHGRAQELGGALDDHNVYLETLAELGPPGLVLLLVALGAPLVAAPRAIAATRMGAAATAAYAAYAIDALVEWDWELPAVTVAGLLLGAALLVIATRRTATQPLELRARTVGIAAAILLAVLALLGLLSNTVPAAATAAGNGGRGGETNLSR